MYSIHWQKRTMYWYVLSAVVNQFYQTRVIDEYVLLGNSVVLKCLVPSFVADFIQVLEWVDDNGNTVGSTIDKQGIRLERLEILSMIAATCERFKTKSSYPIDQIDCGFSLEIHCTNRKIIVCVRYLLLCLVVEQSYQLRVNDEFVLKGNTAVLKCIVPSFMGDFLEIIEWVSEPGESFVINQSVKGL